MVKRRKSRAPKDPYSERESKKYDNPIPSREFIMEALQERGVPMDFPGIAEMLKLDDEDRLEALRRRLKAMEHGG